MRVCTCACAYNCVCACMCADVCMGVCVYFYFHKVQMPYNLYPGKGIENFQYPKVPFLSFSSNHCLSLP